MQTTNDNPNTRFTDTQWHFLGEYPLNELMVEIDNKESTNTSLFFQTIRAMGIHPEPLSNIESMLMRFAKEVRAHLNQGRLESSVYIRLFCQKKTVEDVNSTKSAIQFDAEQTIEPDQIIHQSDAGINGGWGCFLIKRMGNVTEDASPGPYYFVDLYLYREG